MKKFVFLIFTLAIPVAIFLFLKFFGSNTFEVPILYEEGIPGCKIESRPHLIADLPGNAQFNSGVFSKSDTDFTVFGLLQTGDSSIQSKITELVRIQDAFYEIGAPFFVLMSSDNAGTLDRLEKQCISTGLQSANFVIVSIPEAQLSEYLKCGLGMIDENEDSSENLILVDLDRRVRGKYQINDIEQTDQLILELKILKQIM